MAAKGHKAKSARAKGSQDKVREGLVHASRHLLPREPRGPKALLSRECGVFCACEFP